MNDLLDDINTSLDDLFVSMKKSYKKAFEIGKSLSEEVRDESFIKVLDNGTVDKQENNALKLMYGGPLTNHQLSKKLNIPLASATRTTCGLRKQGYLFNIKKILNKGTNKKNALMDLTLLGKKRGLSLLWGEFHSKGIGLSNV